ncbi:pyridoxal phosphate-dependent aminotransferase [Demequina capsici]|uniref:Aminotransferase n=1 Tax=Demequina capsici TaxID=3075620 RepID=A0AA96F6H6_9MICO|nr:aminotransferase class I/II-fold pyridoxal phosphate-dependent enzyme [Demequina sp. OYTSA14]WNM24504.1 aminotransferase class I/II-fold pyridoxal phosphate-dependent enzyme [Demequina sp. OYTSA14]
MSVPTLNPGRSAAHVPGSGIREVVNAAMGREDVIHLEIGEPGARTPAHLVEAAHSAMGSSNRYTHSAGMPALRDAIARRLHRAYGLSAAEDDIVVGQGAVEALLATIVAVTDPGDEVLVPDPAWPNYEMQTLMRGAVPVRYPLRPENGFVPDMADISPLLGPRTKAIVVNSPSNPTGAVFSRAVMAELVEEAARAGVLVISDEVYDQIIFDGDHVCAAALNPEGVVSVFSFSKTYAMTGSRVGYLTGPRWLVPTIAKLQEPILSSVSTASQAAAIEALNGPQDFVATSLASYRDRRDLAHTLLADAGIAAPMPAGAFYMMVPLHQQADSRRAALDLIGHGVATAPGTAFGDVARHFLRISLAAARPDLEEGLARLAGWYHQTNGGIGR